MNIASVGIDLGKTTFHLVALGEHNKVLLRKKFSRPTSAVLDWWRLLHSWRIIAISPIDPWSANSQ